jgi:hypothetical protein
MWYNMYRKHIAAVLVVQAAWYIGEIQKIINPIKEKIAHNFS